jgi:hypothetical protein
MVAGAPGGCPARLGGLGDLQLRQRAGAFSISLPVSGPAHATYSGHFGFLS